MASQKHDRLQIELLVPPMTKIAIRPRFRMKSHLSAEEIQARMDAALKAPQAPCEGTLLNHYAILRIPQEQQHYWSPRLSIEFYEADGETEISGLFSPRAAVWTLFASFYALTIFVGFVGLIWGLVQWQLNLTPHALWLVPISMFFLAVAYASAMAGQRLGGEQMETLRDFFQQSIAK